MYMCQSESPNSSHLPSPFLLISIYSLSMCPYKFYGFKCIIAYIHHYSIPKNCFTTLKTFCVSCIFSLLSPPHPVFLKNSLHSFAFSRMSCGWNHTVYSFCRLASFTKYYGFNKVPHVFPLLGASFLFSRVIVCGLDVQ